MKFQSRITGRSIVITLPAREGEPAAEALVVEIEIACPQCGDHKVRFAGHHLRALRNLIIEMIDRHPSLCGDEAGMEMVNQLQFGGSAPSDPSVN